MFGERVKFNIVSSIHPYNTCINPNNFRPKEDGVIYITAHSNTINQVIKNYLTLCENGDTSLFETTKQTYEILGRKIIINGICLCIRYKDSRHLTLFKLLLAHFQITPDEVLHNVPNILTECVATDNLLAFQYLLEHYNLSLDMNSFYVNLILDTIVAHSSGNIMDYLCNKKIITPQNINDIPDQCVTNRVFLRKYGWQCDEPKEKAIVSWRASPPKINYRRKFSQFTTSKHENIDSDWRCRSNT